MTESFDLPDPMARPGHRPKPLNVSLSTSPSGTLAVTLRHSDGEGVSTFTSSFASGWDMTPARWREVLSAVAAKLDAMAD